MNNSLAPYISLSNEKLLQYCEEVHKIDKENIMLYQIGAGEIGIFTSYYRRTYLLDDVSFKRNTKKGGTIRPVYVHCDYDPSVLLEKATEIIQSKNIKKFTLQLFRPYLHPYHIGGYIGTHPF